MIISFVLAMAKNRAIGIGNHLPWNVPTDMKRFMDTTKGHPIIMGSRTFESMPGGKALPKRTNIVLTHDPNKKYEGAHTFTTIGEAVKFAATQPGGEEVMIIGGGKVFAETLPIAHRIYLTVIDADIKNADTYFPKLDDVRWSRKEVGRFEKDDKNEYGGIFYTYERTNKFPIVEPGNGRNEEYRTQLQRILDSGICPFCPNGETLKEQEVIRTNKSWWLKENAFPLEDAMYHFVLTPNRHIETADDITSAEWEGLKEMRAWLKSSYDMTGDAMYTRSGEPLVTGATVTHLHFHIIVPSGLVKVVFGDYLVDK